MEERIFNYKNQNEIEKLTSNMLQQNFLLIRHESKNKKLFFKKHTPTQEEKI